MRKILLLLIITATVSMHAKPVVIVSILPQLTFVQKIAKDKADITLMIQPGNSPHSYEPKSSQMISISKADVYFSIGVEFEDAWLDRFTSQNPKLKIVNISHGVQKLEIREHHHAKGEHEHGRLDPHTWTSPANVKIMALHIYKTLIKLDSTNKAFYKTNLDAFLQEIKDTDKEIRSTLNEVQANSKFLVLHPSWGYFAKEYNLVQVAVEVEGKSPKPKEMVKIIDEAKEENVRVIFTQPEFSDKNAQTIAKETNISVKKISPLDANWSENLIQMALAIANK